MDGLPSSLLPPGKIQLHGIRVGAQAGSGFSVGEMGLTCDRFWVQPPNALSFGRGSGHSLWSRESTVPTASSPFVCVSWEIRFQERQGFRANAAARLTHPHKELAVPAKVYLGWNTA